MSKIENASWMAAGENWKEELSSEAVSCFRGSAGLFGVADNSPSPAADDGDGDATMSARDAAMKSR